MRFSLLIIFSMTTLVFCGDKVEEINDNSNWPPKLDRNAPCPHPNMERRDGGSASCDENCEDVIAEREGKEKPIRPCILIYIYNECHCKPGFARKAVDNAESPCPLANQHRRDGGLDVCETNCEDIRLERIGKEDIRPCPLVGVINGCFCKDGYVMKSLQDNTCVLKEQFQCPFPNQGDGEQCVTQIAMIFDGKKEGKEPK
ncbi:unnamed protein product, partial [Mesorhabditis belari]|uniref:TIL domain-containing protein n=1 Tax=Mesorhabditis belari TaxID=2138241 RepID=A0AAF3J4N1_9BILA